MFHGSRRGGGSIPEKLRSAVRQWDGGGEIELRGRISTELGSYRAVLGLDENRRRAVCMCPSLFASRIRPSRSWAWVPRNFSGEPWLGRGRIIQRLTANQTNAATSFVPKETKPQTPQMIFHFVGTESFPSSAEKNEAVSALHLLGGCAEWGAISTKSRGCGFSILTSTPSSRAWKNLDSFFWKISRGPENLAFWMRRMFSTYHPTFVRKPDKRRYPLCAQGNQATKSANDFSFCGHGIIFREDMWKNGKLHTRRCFGIIFS